MLLKLNEGEGVTVQVNHIKKTQSLVISCFDGKTLSLRPFPENRDAKIRLHETIPYINKALELLGRVTPENADSMHNLSNAIRVLEGI